MTDAFITYMIIQYLISGILICIKLRMWSAPVNWWKYPTVIFGWPVLLCLAYMGRL